MSYTKHLDVPYPGATGPRQSLDLFLPSTASPNSPLLVFIHGGAWRSESKGDFTETLMPTLVRYTGLPVACLEYRLAPTDPHPAQILDVVFGLSLLTGQLLAHEEGEAKWDRGKLVVVGHSAGAFMAATLILRPPPSTSPAVPSFSVPPAIRHAITAIVCVDGIYDLPAVLHEYPAYTFLHDAFGADPAVHAAESPARWYAYDDAPARNVRVLVLHSRGDELLSLRQPRIFLRRLKQLYGSAQDGDASADDEVGSEADKDLPPNVEVDYDSLTGGHYEVVKGDELGRTLARWLRPSGVCK